MEGRDKRKASIPSRSLVGKRRKSDVDGGSCAYERCTTEVSRAVNFSNFEKSGMPARFMFYEQGEWQNFLQETCATLVAAFQARHNSVEFSVHGSRYLLSFISMLQSNLNTGLCQSIAWIDVSGRIFSPLRCMEGYGIHDHQLGHNFLRDHDLNSSDIISISVPGDAVVRGIPYLTCQHTDTSQQSPKSGIVHMSKSGVSWSRGHDRCDKVTCSASSDANSTIDSSNSMSDVTSNRNGANGPIGSWDLPLLQDKLVRLKETESEFEEVKNRFKAGLSVLANHTTITNISKNCHRSPSGRVRHQAFKQQEEVTKRMRGDSNVRYAWYGTTKKGVFGIVLHGFGQPKTSKDGAMYGTGIYLAPEKYANVSVVYSDVDENGEQHVVLCKVVMGRMEEVCRGSVQFHPGSEDFDVGVDDLCNPKQYIVWSTHMNTHILPEYIISFKLATPWQGIVAALRSKRKASGKSLQHECRYTGPVKVRDDLGAEPIPRCSYSPPKSPWMSIDMLFLLLKPNLSAESMDALQRHYLDFKDGRLPSSDFIKSVRAIAGDHLVSRSIKSMQSHVLGAVVLQNLLASRRYQIAERNIV